MRKMITTVKQEGQTYALVPLDAWQKISTGDLAMPAMPPADEHGRMDAVAFARATIARGIIRDRTAAGLSQAELARRAGIDTATLNRIEKAKVTPDEATVRKIDRALSAAMPRPTRGVVTKLRARSAGGRRPTASGRIAIVRVRVSGKK